MATAATVLAIAAEELGTVEHPPGSNRTKYGAWAKQNGVAWCAIFVSYCLELAGIKGFRHAYTPAGANLFRAASRWHSTPEPGDLAYFDFPGDGLNRISHVGFVEKVLSPTRVQCLEGNTSPGTAGSQRDGGGVYRRIRNRSLIVGYGRPPYGGTTAVKRMLRIGDVGSDVLQLQRDLVVAFPGRAGLTADGEFGAETEAAVRAVQAEQDLGVDGVVDPATFAAIAKALRDIPPVNTIKEHEEDQMPSPKEIAEAVASHMYGNDAYKAPLGNMIWDARVFSEDAVKLLRDIESRLRQLQEDIDALKGPKGPPR